MKILHLTDLHLGQPQAAMRTLPAIQAIRERPDLGDCAVIFGGDTLDTPTMAEVRTAEALIRPIVERAGAVTVVQGNHDKRTSGAFRWLPITPHYQELVNGLGVDCEPYTFGPFRVIPVDSCIVPPGIRNLIDPRRALAQGYLGEEQRGRIALEVRRAKQAGLRSVIAMHHCPTGGNIALRLIDRHALAAELNVVGGADVILSGHLHRRGEWSGVLGSRLILSGPKCANDPGYWELSVEGGLLRHRWIEA